MPQHSKSRTECHPVYGGTPGLWCCRSTPPLHDLEEKAEAPAPHIKHRKKLPVVDGKLGAKGKPRAVEMEVAERSPPAGVRGIRIHEEVGAILAERKTCPAGETLRTTTEDPAGNNHPKKRDPLPEGENRSR